MIVFHGTQSPAVFYIQRIICEIFDQRLDLNSCRHLLATLALKPGTSGARFNSYAELNSELRNGAAIELCSGYYPDGLWEPDDDFPEFPCEGSEDAQRRANSPFISRLSGVHKLRATDTQISSLNMALDHYPIEMVLALEPPKEMDFDVERAAMVTRRLESGQEWSFGREFLLLGFTAYQDAPLPKTPDGIMYIESLNGVIARALAKETIIAHWHFAKFPNAYSRTSKLENIADRVVFTAAFEDGNWVPVGWAQGLSLVSSDLHSLMHVARNHGDQAERMVACLYDALSSNGEDFKKSKLEQALSSSPVTITALNHAEILLSDPAVSSTELEAALLDCLCNPTPSIRLKTIPHQHTIDSATVILDDSFPGFDYTGVALLPVHDLQTEAGEGLSALKPEVIRLYQSRNLVHPSLAFNAQKGAAKSTLT